MQHALAGRLLALSPGDIVLSPEEDMIASALARLVGDEEARRILTTVSPAGLVSMSAPELVHVAGVSEELAGHLVAARELAELLLRTRPPIASASDRVVSILPPGLATLEFEVFIALALGSDLAVRAAVLIAKGGAHAVSCARHDILRPLVRMGATKFVIVHNHPSGDPQPSRDDVAFTAELLRAARSLDMELLDHIVIARDGHVSFADLGVIEKLSATGGGAREVPAVLVASGDRPPRRGR